MPADHTASARGSSEDFLLRHVRDLPYFRGMLRAVETRFYQDRELPAPTYDLGCGDGHFARLTFQRPIDIGLDPWRAPLDEARRQGAHGMLVQADAARSPFPTAHFGGAFSNSVLEHIPHAQDVLNETARILRPGAPFLFCVPNSNFTHFLSVARFFDHLRLRRLGAAYRRFFNRISRHLHCDPPEVWRQRLKQAGFEIDESWNYFSPSALAVLEWGHYFGLPAAICKLLFGRWILVRSRLNLWLTLALVRRHYNEAVPQEHGAYSFFVARRLTRTSATTAKKRA